MDRGPQAMRRTGRAAEQPNTPVVAEPIRLELVRAPAGEFPMGSHPAVDREAAKAELPQHRVTLAELSLGRRPVTNAGVPHS